MILVDTSVWIDHFHAANRRLEELLGEDEVGCHPLVLEELALGSIKDRDVVLSSLGSLRSFPTITHYELLTLVEAHALWGRGLSAVDAHLLGAVALVADGVLWTRDKRLLTAASDIAIRTIP